MLVETDKTYLPHGWRAKIAFMLPSSCLVYEQEFAAATSQLDGVIGIPARLPIEKTDVSGLAGMNEHITAAAHQLAGTEPDVLAYMCTSGSFMDGSDGDLAIRSRIEGLTDAAVTSTSLAVITALDHVGARSAALLSPYDDDMARREEEWLTGAGLNIADHRNLDIVDNLDRGRLPPSVALRHALELNWGDADCILLSCANVAYEPIVDELEEITGRSVITSSRATTWHALRLAGIEDVAIGRRE